MSRVAELIARKRAAQIAAMQGKTVDTSDVDEALADVSPPDTDPARYYSGARLHIPKHCWTRMSQRGIRVRDLYAIWHYGERAEQENGRSIHVVRDDTWREAPERDADRLRQLVGAAIIVQPPWRPDYDHMVVTVLPFGRDTRARLRRS